jgi:tetratricopeptide (TPR) repeat protein
MIRSIFFLFVVLSAVSFQGQDVAYLVNQGKELEKQMKDQEALLKYLEALKIAPNNVQALCGASDMYCILGNRQKDKNKKVEYYNAARTYASLALKQSPSNADANYSMAVAMGRMALISSGKEEIENVREIKKYCDAALAVSPNHVRATHVLGKWHFEVSTLNFAKKAALKVIYGGLPPASLADAIKYFEKARSLDGTFVLNYLELAKAYKENGQSDKAIDVLTRMQKLPPKTADDPSYKAEGKKMLESLL